MSIDFGFKKNKKQHFVQGVFTKIADKYDIMNNIMSFGLHQQWKNILVNQIDSYKDQYLLDLAGGTGDVAKNFINRGGDKAIVYDLNQKMLNNGEISLYNKLNEKYLHNIRWLKGSAENIAFSDNTFDFCTISFGLRNVTNIKNVLQESLRVLKPGGKFICLEFSKIDNKVMAKIYHFYSFKIIPKIGLLIAGSQDAYQYLVESIKQFYNAEELKTLMKNIGYYSVKYKMLSFGVVAIHSGYKIY